MSSIAEAVLRAILFMSSHGIIHCDIEATSIFVGVESEGLLVHLHLSARPRFFNHNYLEGDELCLWRPSACGRKRHRGANTRRATSRLSAVVRRIRACTASARTSLPWVICSHCSSCGRRTLVSHSRPEVPYLNVCDLFWRGY